MARDDDRYSHRPGCGCPACIYTRRVRAETGNDEWDHRSGCDCSRCQTVRNLADARDLSKWLKNRGD